MAAVSQTAFSSAFCHENCAIWLDFYQNLFPGSNHHQIVPGLRNGLLPYMLQAITWPNDDKNHEVKLSN